MNVRHSIGQASQALIMSLSVPSKVKRYSGAQVQQPLWGSRRPLRCLVQRLSPPARIWQAGHPTGTNLIALTRVNGTAKRRPLHRNKLGCQPFDALVLPAVKWTLRTCLFASAPLWLPRFAHKVQERKALSGMNLVATRCLREVMDLLRCCNGVATV